MCAFFQNFGSFFWRFKIPFFPNTSRSPFPKNPTSWDGKALAVPSKLPQVLEPYKRGIISIYPINTHVIFQVYMVLIIFWVPFWRVQVPPLNFSYDRQGFCTLCPANYEGACLLLSGQAARGRSSSAPVSAWRRSPSSRVHPRLIHPTI